MALLPSLLPSELHHHTFHDHNRNYHHSLIRNGSRLVSAALSGDLNHTASPSGLEAPVLVAVPTSSSAHKWESMSTWLKMEHVIPIIVLVAVLLFLVCQLLVFYCCCVRHRESLPKGKPTDEIPRPQVPRMSIFSYLTLLWIKPLLFRAQEGNALAYGTMLPLWADIEKTCEKAFPLWDAQMAAFRAHGTQPRFWPVFAAVFGRRYFIMGFLKLFSLALSLLGPIILRSYLDALSEADNAAAVLNGALLVFLGLSATMLNTHSSLYRTSIAMEVGGLAGCANFRRISRLSCAESARFGSGFIQQVVPATHKRGGGL